MAIRTMTKKAEPKTTAAKPMTEKEAPAKTTAEPAKKAEPVKAAETKKPVETEKKEETMKKEEPAKKTAVKKAAAPRKTAEKKPAAKKAEKKAVPANTEVYVQFLGKEVYAKDLVENIKKIWTDEMGKKEEEIQDLKVYIKPEDNGAYYVINGEAKGFLVL